MSWTDVFPVLSDEQLDLYRDLATPAEKADLDAMFAVKRTIQPQTGDHLISTSLFWKKLSVGEGELPTVTRDSMMRANDLGLTSRYAPWEHYVEPLLEGAAKLKKTRPEVVFRVYLAADLEFLIPDLVAAGCEVKLMESSSISHNPGAMWRFLALEEKDRWFTIIDSDRAPEAIHDLERTEHVVAAGLGAWRVPYVFDHARHEFNAGFYRPMNASQFGGKGGHSVGSLMKALIWHGKRGTMPVKARLPASKHEVEIAGTVWPDYGYDEWFLLTALYPRLAFEGFVTFISGKPPKLTCWHGLDVEYVTWANPGSEFFICQQGGEEEGRKPWEDWKAGPPLSVRPGSIVIRRKRAKIGAVQRIFSEQPSPFLAAYLLFQGGLPELLAWAAREVSETWWIDVNPGLKMSDKGSELFTSRCHEHADVVVCGSWFFKVTPEVSGWAVEKGLPPDTWSTGKLLKVPKLDGPMTLWNTRFSRIFADDLARESGAVRPEILLRAWMQKGQAEVAETTARGMGWDVR